MNNGKNSLKKNELQSSIREDYSRLLEIGILLSVLLIVLFGGYWLSEGERLARAASNLEAEQVALGSALYAAQCASCHGITGEGGVGFALNDQALLKNTPDNLLYSLIRTGVPNTQMPAWGIDFGGPLTDEDIRHLVAYIRAWEK